MALTISAQYQMGKAPDDISLQIYDEQSLDPMTLLLHGEMREIAIKRQNRAPLVKKIKFALCDEKHLKALVNEISNLTKDFVDLSPAQIQKLSELAAREVSDFSEPLRVLSDAATGQDEALVLALAQVLKPVVSHVYAVLRTHKT